MADSPDLDGGGVCRYRPLKVSPSIVKRWLELDLPGGVQELLAQVGADRRHRGYDIGVVRSGSSVPHEEHARCVMKRDLDLHTGCIFRSLEEALQSTERLPQVRTTVDPAHLDAHRAAVMR